MSPLQTALYFREWGKVRAHFRARGIDASLVDTKRHELHKRALGLMKSSKDFTNADLDKVLAVFRSITQPDNLAAQLRQIDQPERRRQDCWAKCVEILVALKIGQKAFDEDDRLNRQVRYVDGIVAKVISGKLRWDQLDDKEANIVLGILRRRKMYQDKARAKHAAPVAATKEPDPF